VSGEKLQAPTSKLQRNFKLQAPIAALYCIGRLVIGASLDVGVWSLELYSVHPVREFNRSNLFRPVFRRNFFGSASQNFYR
jgi:hypothetical protein